MSHAQNNSYRTFMKSEIIIALEHDMAPRKSINRPTRASEHRAKGVSSPLTGPLLRRAAAGEEEGRGVEPPALGVKSKDDDKGMQAEEDAERRFGLTFQNGLPGNECRLSAADFRAMKAEPGSILLIQHGSTRVAVLEAWISSALRSGAVEVSSDLSPLFGDSNVVVVSPLTTPSISSVISLAVLMTLLNSSKNDEVLPESIHWKAIFRQHLLHRIVYVGMRTTIQSSLCNAVVEVVEVKLSAPSTCCSELAYGLLTAATKISMMEHFGGVVKDAATDPSDQDAFLPSTFRHHLVVGDRGTGKTFTIEEELKQHQAAGRSVLYATAEVLMTETSGGISSPVALHNIFERARRHRSSTIVMDDLDLLCGSSGSAAGSSWAMNLLAVGLAGEVAALQERGEDVCILASATSTDALHPLVLSTSVLGGHVTTLSIPSTIEEKKKCLKRCILDICAESTLDDDACGRIVESVHGYSQRDYHSLVELAVATSFQSRCSLDCSEEEMSRCTRRVQPSSLRQFDIAIPDVTWGDIGGSETAKKVLRDLVRWALGDQREVFEQFHLSPPRGVLLYGPPGCSKTMLAKALANESRLNFISVKGPEVFSKWVGDSEKAVRNIFSKARAAAPCVVFIDELDGMCGHRGQGGVADRVISQFLTELDGLPSAMSQQKDAVIFVAATNRPDNIDAAVMRPGRIDKILHIGLPDAEERKAIAAIQFRRMPVASDVTPAFVAACTEGYSGAEVVAVIKEAAFHALGVSMQSECVSREDVEEALRKVQPRTRKEDVEWYCNWRLSK